MNEYMNTPSILNRPKKANQYGEYDDRIKVKVLSRIELKDELVKDDAGVDRNSRGVIYSTSRIVVNDEITYNEVNYKVFKASTVTDLFNKIKHYKGYLI